MSEQVAETTNTENPSAVEPKKGGKKLIIIILAVLLVCGGGGAYFFMRSSGSSETETEAKSEKKSKPDSEDEETGEESAAKSSKSNKSLKAALPKDEDVKSIIELQPFIVNLADTEQARYLRMSVSLGVGGEGGESEKPDQLFMTRVRNAMLAVLSDKNSDEILSTEGKAKLRKDLLKAAQAAADEPEVQAIYITDFIVQL
jgi:flagellar FliL protein